MLGAKAAEYAARNREINAALAERHAIKHWLQHEAKRLERDALNCGDGRLAAKLQGEAQGLIRAFHGVADGKHLREGV